MSDDRFNEPLPEKPARKWAEFRAPGREPETVSADEIEAFAKQFAKKFQVRSTKQKQRALRRRIGGRE